MPINAPLPSNADTERGDPIRREHIRGIRDAILELDGRLVDVEGAPRDFVKVIHGANAATARPNAVYVLWEGSVQPANWIDGDDWNQTA